MKLLWRCLGGLLGAVFALAAHADDGLTTWPLRIETASGVHRLTVEIAATQEQRMRGLMARDTLAPDAGMLFVYAQPQPEDAGFWMYHTRIPLDIAFLGADGRILTIVTMQPCPESLGSRCPSYRPRVPYSAALEVNSGYFAAHGIVSGDHVLFVPPAQRKPAAGAQ